MNSRCTMFLSEKLTIEIIIIIFKINSNNFLTCFSLYNYTCIFEHLLLFFIV